MSSCLGGDEYMGKGFWSEQMDELTAAQKTGVRGVMTG
jgi:hypothetical protein